MLIQHVDISYYIDKLVYRLDNLKPHHFITKTQASYLKNIKDNLDNKTAIVLLDYAENYNFIYQDAIQSVHWDNTQATLHPAVIYVNNNNNLIVNSTCIISNHMIHNTSSIHSFLEVILKYIKNKFPNIEKIIYFSDGASLSYIGIIIEQSIENCDVKVKFMKKVNQNIFTWPLKDDQCWIPYQDIIKILQSPNIINSRQYKFNSNDIVNIP